MKTQRSLRLVPFVTAAATLLLGACSKSEHSAHNTSAATDAAKQSKRYPLKGVVTDIMPEQSALLVKHEEIPGYMMAMTMLFKVDAATLKAAVKGQTITGTLVEAGEEFSLEDMKPVTP